MLFLHKLEICLKSPCFTSSVYLCYVKRKMKPTVFHTSLNLVRVWEDFPIELSAYHPPTHNLCPISDSTLEEAVGVNELVHWEAPLAWTLNPEVHQVKEFI